MGAVYTEAAKDKPRIEAMLKMSNSLTTFFRAHCSTKDLRGKLRMTGAKAEE